MNDSQKFEKLLYETKKGVAWLIWNEPERLNPFSPERVMEITKAIDIAEDDDDARIIAFKGQGRAYSGGAEIKPYRAGIGLEFFNYHRTVLLPLWEKIWNSKKPIVVAAHGYCIGFALETALRADIMICAEGTKLGELEIQINSPYGNQRIGRLASEKIQMWYSLTGDLMDASEALQYGIINRVVTLDNLDDAVYEFCEKVSRWSPEALWFNRIAIKYGLNCDEKAGWLIESALESIVSTTRNWAIGVSCFNDEPRRKPTFVGNLPKNRFISKVMFSPGTDSFVTEEETQALERPDVGGA